MIVDAMPFYTLLFDPSATSETATPHAAAMRDAMLAARPSKYVSTLKALARPCARSFYGPKPRIKTPRVLLTAWHKSV